MIKKIIIKNFKSIKKAEIEIRKIGEKTCFIFLGKNEGGKSNILEAISLKDKKEEDLNYNLLKNKKCENNEEISIKYEFEEHYLDSNIDSIKDVPKELKKIIEIQSIVQEVVVSKKGCYNYFFILIKDNERKFSNYTLEEGIIREVEVKPISSIDDIDFRNRLNKKNLEEYLEKIFSNTFRDDSKIIFWRYEEKYLINESINLNNFKDDFNISIPLRNCFLISGISEIEIKERIENSISPANKSELGDLLGREITKHINQIWKEHRINIKIIIDGEMLSFLIEEQDDSLKKFETSQRSDGFKQFISILLNLSIENETGNLKNKLILLDEPEIHLHPSGQKFLLNELLKISENNLVFFTTHSIYMVDKEYLNRHFSIYKEKTTTKVSQIEKENPYKEEVLYEALGTSVLEHINPNVLIFEGKIDKDIFDLYCIKFKTDIDIPLISLISADGVKNIIKYCKFFNKNIIKSFILVDSDKDGKEEKKKIIKEYGNFNSNIFEINDLIEDKKDNSELEDLFNKRHLEEILKNNFSRILNLNEKNSFNKQIKIEDKKNDTKKLRNLFWEKISKLTKEDLKKEKYYSFFEELIKKINN